MSTRTYRTFQALILAVLGLYLLLEVMDGGIQAFINPRSVILLLLASLGLIILAQFALRDRPDPHGEADPTAPGEEDAPYIYQRPGWLLWLAALPLLLGILAPERSLTALALRARGVNLVASMSLNGAAAQALKTAPEQRSVLDWIRVFNAASDLDQTIGQPADVTGFVVHDPRFLAGQFVVARFVVVNSSADAAATGLVVRWTGAGDLPENGWVRVRGKIETGNLAGKIIPVMAATQVELIPAPSQPYLFP